MNSAEFYNFSKKEEFGISNAERYAFISFMSFVFITSLIGDLIILVSSIRFKALRLNGFIVSTIQHLAVCDILGSLLFILPQIISLMANEWVLGNFLCQVTALLPHYLGCVNRIQTAVMATARVIKLKLTNSRAALSMTGKAGHVIGVMIWFSVLPLSIAMVYLEYNGAYFDYRTALCDIPFRADTWKYLIPSILVLYVFVPLFVVIVTTGILLYHLARARQVSRRIGATEGWQGLVTVTMTATVFCLSNLPFIVYRLALNLITDIHGFFHNEFYRSVWALLSINILCNFFIYCITINSFREFLKDGVQNFMHNVILCRNAIHGRILQASTSGKKVKI